MSDIINADILTGSMLGRELAPDECAVLAGIMQVRTLADGEDLVRAGDTSRTLFLLADGTITVNTVEAGQEQRLYVMKAGECAGTRAFVEGAPRAATLRARGATTVYTVEPEAMETLIDTHPRIIYKLMRGLFRQTHENLVKVDRETQQLSNYINKTGGRY